MHVPILVHKPKSGKATQMRTLAWGYHATDATRNDFVVVNDVCLPIVRGVRVLHHEGFLVHSVLQFKLQASKFVTSYEAPRKPASIYSLLRKKSFEEWTQNEPKEAEGKDEEELLEMFWKVTKEHISNTWMMP